MPLVLRSPRPADETSVRVLQAELAREDFAFLTHDGPWDEVLARIDRDSKGVDLPPGRVRADFLLAEVDHQVIGRVSIRYALNDYLARVGGHVGYAVGPAFRRRGHATEILRQSVARLAEAGVKRVLVTCDDDNLGSAAVIERCGGVLDNTVDDGGNVKRRYWIVRDQACAQRRDPPTSAT